MADLIGCTARVVLWLNLFIRDLIYVSVYEVKASFNLKQITVKFPRTLCCAETACFIREQSSG